MTRAVSVVSSWIVSTAGTGASTQFGHPVSGFTRPALLISRLGIEIGKTVDDEPIDSTGPSLFGSVVRSVSGAGYGYATRSHRLAASSIPALPVTSTTRIWPATGQLNRTRMATLDATAV